MLIEDIGNLLSDDDFRRVKTEILVQMQGVGQENEGLHVILTTNEPWMISCKIKHQQILMLLLFPYNDPHSLVITFSSLIACDTSSLQTHPANTLRENMPVFNWIIFSDSALRCG
jgi:hypothetical protein